METYNKIVELVEAMKADADKFFDKGNKSAGVRLRKGLQDIKALAQIVRVEVSEANKEKGE